MTKKDYEKFALLLKQTNPANYSIYGKETLEREPYLIELELEQHSRIITGIASIFKEDNPKFDINKFIKAITDATHIRKR